MVFIRILLTFLYILLYGTEFLIHAHTTADIVASYGYPVENHKVTTDDGYILQLFRIPPVSKPIVSYVVFMMHDILCSSDDLVVGGPDINWPYVFANLSFDVWLGNARGNKYSMGHTTLNASDNNSTYWDFSWHEIGIYDLPAMIDYILKFVNINYVTELHYIGHGQGTTAFFVMAAMLPEYIQKIGIVYAFAPAVFFGHVPSPYIKNVSHEFIQNKTKMIEYSGRKFESSENILNDFGRSQCLNEIHDSSVCNDIYYLITGYRKDLTNVIIDKQRSCSTNQLLHYAQLVETGRFAENNYGPDYNIANNINVQISIFVTTNDLTVSGTDLQTLYDLLPKYTLLGNYTCKNIIHVDILNIQLLHNLLCNIHD